MGFRNYLATHSKHLPTYIFTGWWQVFHLLLSNVLCPLFDLPFSLSGQQEAVMHFPCSYFLIPIGWKYSCVQSPEVAGVALSVS